MRAQLALAMILITALPVATTAAAAPGRHAGVPAPLIAQDCAAELTVAGTRLRGRGCPATEPAGPASAPAHAGAIDHAHDHGGDLAPLPCAVGVPVLDDRCETWSARFDGGEGDVNQEGLGAAEVVATSADSDTAFVVSVTDVSPGAAIDRDLLVVAHRATDGDRVWASTIPTAGSATEAVGVVANPVRDEVYVLARSDGSAPCEHSTVLTALDSSTGTRAWTADATPQPGRCDSVQTLQTNPSGTLLFVIGGSTGTDGVSRFLVTAYDTRTGLEVWQDDYRGGLDGGSLASALGVSPDGETLYVAGADIARDATFGRYLSWPLVAYDAGTGARRWVHRWDAPKPQAPSPANPPAGVVVSPDGGTAFVTGGAEGATLFDIFTLAHDTADGTLRWTNQYEGIRATIKSSFDSVWYHRPLAVSPDGAQVYVAGYSTSLHGVNLAMDFVALGIDATDGASVWSARHTSDEWIHWTPSVAASPDGNTVYLSGPGRHFQLISASYETFAYDAATGEQRWAARHNDGFSYWHGMSLSPDGTHLFVGGSTVPYEKDPALHQSYDLLTAAYGAR